MSIPTIFTLVHLFDKYVTFYLPVLPLPSNRDTKVSETMILPLTIIKSQ